MEKRSRELTEEELAERQRIFDEKKAKKEAIAKRKKEAEERRIQRDADRAARKFAEEKRKARQKRAEEAAAQLANEPRHVEDEIEPQPLPEHIRSAEEIKRALLKDKKAIIAANKAEIAEINRMTREDLSMRGAYKSTLLKEARMKRLRALREHEENMMRAGFRRTTYNYNHVNGRTYTKDYWTMR